MDTHMHAHTHARTRMLLVSGVTWSWESWAGVRSVAAALVVKARLRVNQRWDAWQVAFSCVTHWRAVRHYCCKKLRNKSFITPRLLLCIRLRVCSILNMNLDHWYARSFARRQQMLVCLVAGFLLIVNKYCVSWHTLFSLRLLSKALHYIALVAIDYWPVLVRCGCCLSDLVCESSVRSAGPWHSLTYTDKPWYR